MVNKNDSLISIIVPVYNAEKYVERCIDSLIAQEYSNIQIILVDDGSYDSSLSICKRKALDDSRILVLHQENQGVSSARNYGLSKADGEYVTFCDSDDIYRPGLIYILHENLVRNEADLSGCSYLKVTSIADFIFEKKTVSDTLILDQQASVEKIIREADGYLWNKLFKKSLIGNNPFPEDIAILEDEVFVLHYMKACDRAVFTSEPLYIYWDNPASVVNRSTITNQKLSDIVARERIVGILEEMCVNENVIGAVWNELLKSYAISFKKLLLISDKELSHWKNYVLKGFSRRKHDYKRDNTWSAKELIYLNILRICSLLVG